jgi:hypothetical protein
VGSGLVNDKGWSSGVGVGSGEVKAGTSVVAVWSVAEKAIGLAGTSVESKDNTSSNEIFWVSDGI